MPPSDRHKLRLQRSTWDAVRGYVPIACADIVITRGRDGMPAEVALIKRLDRDGAERWCHLGGRVGMDERVRAAAVRHVLSTLQLTPDEAKRVNRDMPTDPACAFEFMRSDELASSDSGVDPDKHAISWCFELHWPAGAAVEPNPSGEAMAIRWFPLGELPEPLWPGTGELVRRVTSIHHATESYAAISAQAATHNGLMWQTPVLAMTAQAFLLTISLGAGINPLSRLGSAALSATVSALSIQLMMKHSAMQHRDMLALERIERSRGMLVHHVKPTFDTRGLQGWLIRQPSRSWWLAGMALFGFVSLIIVAVAAARLISP